jgi:hypothetical protein
MPVSKRLRFEILRRDNHQCRYCGAKAPDVPLRVDHVVPVALGGGDDPANLVTACEPCNSGKSSVPADAPLVADVARDALMWGKAMEIVAQGRATERLEAEIRYAKFHQDWQAWTWTNWQGEHHFTLPQNWRTTVDQVLAAGLEMDDLTELIRVAMESPADDRWRYFCGCCWRRIREAQEHAANIVALAKDRLDG